MDLFDLRVERLFFKNIETGTYEDWKGLIYRHIRSQFGYEIGDSPSYFHFLKRSKAMMLICIRQNRVVLGVNPLFTKSTPTKTQFTSAKNFLSHYAHSKVIFVTKEIRDIEVIQENIMIASAANVLY